MSSRYPGRCATALAVILAVPPAAGQPEPTGEQISGWHIVRQGESLIQITQSYLGTAARWREVWKLNPDLESPHVLVPGQRIRVFLTPLISVPTARLQSVSGRVEDKPNPLPWSTAQEQDLLVERDGIRTFESSSTEMQFEDGTSVLLTEESLVFVRRAVGARPAAGSQARRVEIVEGQADVAAAADLAAPVEVEIVVAGTTARPQRGEGGASQTRARTGRSGGAELMVYEGSSAVEAAGQQVDVATGMGTAVPEGKPPSPPEKLLPAPEPRAPESGSEWAIPDPLFTWSAVAGAQGYTVEVCADPECTRLVRRMVDLTSATLIPQPLPVAALHWRVTAVSASGLDGYPSRTVPFTVLSDQRDADPPTGRISLTGTGYQTGGRTLRDGGTVVSVEVTDEASGVADWTARVNGAEVAAERLAGPWETGSYKVEVTAVDRAGNPGELTALRFEVDADPPEIRWDIRWVRPMLTHVKTGIATPRWLRAKRRFAAWAHRELGGDAARGFLVLASGSDDSELAASYRPRPFVRDPANLTRGLRIEGNRPRAVILAPGVDPPSDPRSGPLADGRFLWVRAEDETSGMVEGMTVSSAGGELVFEASDPLGNRARLVMPFR